MLVAATALLSLTAGLGPLPSAWRAWPVAGLAAWAWLLACNVASVPIGVRSAVLAVAAVAIVVMVHLVPPTIERWMHRGSLGLAGHSLALAALVATEFRLGGALAVAVALATAGWSVTGAFDSRDRSPVGDVLRSADGFAGAYVAPVLVAAGAPISVALALDAAGIMAITAPWAPALLAITCVGYAAAVRAPLGDTVRNVLVVFSIGAGVLAAALSSESGPALVGLLSIIACSALLPTDRRPRLVVWLAWAAVAPVIGLIGVIAVPALGAMVTAEAAALALVAVGSFLVVAASAIDLRRRAWVPVTKPTEAWLTPPALLGALEVVAGFLLAVSTLSHTAAGSLSVAVAVSFLVVAVLARAGVLAAPGLAIGWLATWLLAGERIETTPWISVLVTILILLGAELASRVVVDSRWWARLDLPLIAVAHLTAITALVSAGEGDSFGRTVAAVGLLVIATAARCRAALLIASCYAVVGTVLVLVAAVHSGPGWTALALAGLSVGCSVVAARVGPPARWALIVVGALSALAAWSSTLAWIGWTLRQSVDATVVLAAAIALVCAALVRLTPIPRDVLLVRGTVAAATATLTPAVPIVLEASSHPVTTLSYVTCAALVVVAISFAILARPLSLPVLRFVATAYVLAAEIEALVVAGSTAGVQASVLGATSMVCAILVLTPIARGRLSTWSTPVMALGSAAAFATVVVAGLELPNTVLMTPALLVAAAQLGAISLARRDLVVAMFVPPLVCAAWIFYAVRALNGNPQWFMVPVGLTVLVVVGLMRVRLRRLGQDPAASEVVALELIGITCLVGSAFVQAFTESLAYSALAALLGLLIVGWGLLTQVRRRVAAGAVVVLLAALVLVGIPLAQLIPAWTAAALWIAIAVVGLLAILGATLLEQGRAVVHRGAANLRRMTEGWE